MVEKMKVQELTENTNLKDIVNKGQQDNVENFSKDIKNTENKKEISDAFNEHSNIILQSIYENMLTSFETIDATKLQTYKNAKIAFEEDMKTLGITNTNTNTNTLLKNLQDLIDLKQISTITDKTRLEKLKIIAEEKKEKKTEEIKEKNKIIKNNLIDLNEEIKKINEEIGKRNAKRDEVITQIDKQINILEKQQETKLNNFKNINITKENAKKFFEGDQTTYNDFLQQVFTETNTQQNNEKKIKITSLSTGSANTLYERVKAYAGKDVGPIIVGQAKNFDNKDGIKARFGGEERVIQYTEAQVNKFIIQGTTVQMQQRIAENNKNKITKPINRTTQYRKIKTGEIFNTEDDAKSKAEKGEEIKQVKSSLNVFDDIGNFAAFKLYLDNPNNTDNITNNLGEILKQITTYAPSAETADAKDGKIPELKNGYANVMTEYIITHPALLEVYMSYITVDNLNLFGADQATRRTNYNKLFFSDANKGTIRPEIENLMKTKGDSYKMDLLQKIANVKNAIEGPKVKGFDSLIQAFGPMVISILKLLGFGKSSLLKIFPQAKDKINEQFKKEYGLNKKQKEFIDAINKNGDFPKDSNPKNETRLETGEELKKHFTKDKIDAYKTLIETKDNITNINVNVFQKGLNTYNKKQKEEKADHIDININDIVTIETKKVDGRQKQFITGIKPNKDNEVKAVIDTILDADETRARIASANTAIQTPSKDNPNINEQGIDNQAKTKYKISNQNDIARYLTASLFSDKDLDYVMTENQLNNGENITNSTTNSNTAEVKTDKPELKFIDKMYDEKSGVTATGAAKMIHEVIDMNNAPDKIKVTRGTTETIAVKKEITDGNKKTTTYVPESTTTNLTMNNRVKIKNGDKIELNQ